MGIRSKTARKESRMNKAELRALKQQQEELRAIVEKQQEEIKAQADLERNKETKEQAESGNKDVPTKAKEDPMPVPAWKLLYLRTPRSAPPTKNKVRKVVRSERGRKGDSDLEREQKEKREEVSRAMARVLRYDDVNKIWYTQKDISTTFKEMKRFQNVDEGVLHTMVRDVVQEGEGPMKRKRFVFSETRMTFTLVLHDKKAKEAKADAWSTENKIGSGENPHKVERQC